MKLLVNSGEFWSALKEDIRGSKDYVYIQTLSFEGDQTGKMISDELLSAQVKEVRIIADIYTTYVISDRFLYRPGNYFDKEIQSEYADTLEMIKKLKCSGIKFKFTNPVGPLFIKFPARNHKKMILVDDHISYIGGINFSDHNFEWHDLMIRIDDPDITTYLKNDFLSTWERVNVYSQKTFKGIQIHLWDGYSNRKACRTLFKIIDEAQKSIFIESAYTTFPFYDKLREARKRGVKVIVITPGKNNRKNIQRYTPWEAQRSGFDLRLYQPGMTHVKAMLVDDHTLVFGTTNFDYLSYTVYQELVAIITEADIINDFKQRVVQVDLQNSKKFVGEISYPKGFLHYLGLKTASQVAIFPSRVF